MACDIYKAACNTYKLNFNQEPLGNICDIDPETLDEYDILCADFHVNHFTSW